jgi:hypothetical protein
MKWKVFIEITAFKTLMSKQIPAFEFFAIAM